MEELNTQKFVTDMMHYASGAESPNQILGHIVQYIGENLASDRAYIFEDNNDGTFNNTYEWCREGVSAEISNLQNVPFEGLIDVWYAEYSKSHNIIIYDIEEYRSISEAVYQALKPQGITRLVTGPIEIDGKYIGFYGVDNPPTEIMENISELIDTMEFVLVMMIKLRNYSRRLEEIALIDELTKCRNRAALNWAFDGKYDKDQSLGVIMCDLNGLKKKNDLYGHEAGDKYLMDAGDVLKNVFQKENVYRVGGDEFAVVLSAWDEEQICEGIRKIMEDAKARAVSFSVGYSFLEKAAGSFDDLFREADKRMYEDKRKYYESDIFSRNSET